MRYISTRGGMPPKPFSEVFMMGLAPDGGLVVPEQYPKISLNSLATWRGLSYSELAFEIIRLFVSDISEDDLHSIVSRTYTHVVFSSQEITPLKWLDDGIAILELSNGPTLSFKDIAMQFLGNLFEYVLARQGTCLNILGATSGDTGSAAEYAMRGKAGIRVFMLSPDGLMSPFQRAQMYSLYDDNIHNIAIRGMFDDCQDIVKAVQNDHAFKMRHKIGTVNSINWARVMAQVVYYFKGYFSATSNNKETVSFCVPSGNFGNAFAGHIARQMGLPIGRLLVATNENDVLDEFFRTGRYRPRGLGNTYVTSSPSMDISKASNFERFVFDLLGRDSAVLKTLWREVDAGGGFDLPFEQAAAKVFGFASGKSQHADRMATIRQIDRENGLVVDTHTADGVKVARELRRPGEKMICLETALPAKFSATIREALERDPPRPAGYEGLESRPQKVSVCGADAVEVKAFIERTLSPLYSVLS